MTTQLLRLMKKLFRPIGVALLLTLLISGTSSAALQNRPWTTVGSAGTVDEEDLPLVAFGGLNGEVLQLAGSTLGKGLGLEVRYNVVAVDDVTALSGGIRLTVRYRDTGRGRLVLRLKECNLHTGIVLTRMTFDSDRFPASSATQVQTVADCSPNWRFDFVNNSYFVEAQLTNVFAGEDVQLVMIQIGRFTC